MTNNSKATTVIQTRISTKLRDEASEVLESMGLTINEYIRVALTQAIVQKHITLFQPKQPTKLEQVEAWIQTLPTQNLEGEEANDLRGSIQESKSNQSKTYSNPSQMMTDIFNQKI